MSNGRLAVEISQNTPNGCYVTFTEYLTTIKEAQQLIVDYDKGYDFYDVQHRRQG